MHNDYADRKNGRKPVEYFHPDAEEVLGRHLRPDDLPGVGDAGRAEVRRLLAGRGRQPAQGVRQEDPRADRPRSARSSSPACEATGYGAELGTELFDIIEPFADYAFNKRHAYGYGLVAYQTAYLKANYPVEYLAALLTSVKANLDKAGDLPQRVPHDGHRGARARRQPVASPTSSPVIDRRRPGERRRSRSGCRRCATSARASSRPIVARARGQRPLRRLLRLLRPRRPRRCSTSGRSSR